MSTARLEAFSDGVMAVAITLLVLDLVVPAPHHGGHSLAHNLGEEWADYVAYVVSFVTIGIVWINHHAALSRLAKVDRAILMLNLGLLMSIVLLPFATKLMAIYLSQHGADQRVAAAIYGGALLVMSTIFAALNRHVLLAKAHLLREPLTLAQRRRLLYRALGGLIPYVVATALAAVSAYITIALCGIVAVYYALPASAGASE